MSARFDQAEERLFAERKIVGAGESMQIGEGQAAPGGAEHSERGDAVGGMEQSTGEGGEIEDLLTVAQGFDIDGAKGDCVAAQRGDDLGEVVTAAHQNGDAPGLVAAGWKRSVKPIGCNAGDGFGIAMGLRRARDL